LPTGRACALSSLCNAAGLIALTAGGPTKNDGMVMATIIEKAGLVARVKELVSEGITSGARIAALLKAENPGMEISPSSATRFVKGLVKQAEKTAGDALQDHVNRVVPDDLTALEKLEKQCLEWAAECGQDQADRIAVAVRDICGELDLWRALIISDEGRDDETIAKKIVSRAVRLIQRDARLQSQRIKSMDMAVKIIALKLSKAGLLDSDARNPIVIMKRDQETLEADIARLQGAVKKERNLVSFPGGAR